MFLYTQLSLGLLVISVNMGWESSLMSWFDIGKLAVPATFITGRAASTLNLAVVFCVVGVVASLVGVTSVSFLSTLVVFCVVSFAFVCLSLSCVVSWVFVAIPIAGAADVFALLSAGAPTSGVSDLGVALSVLGALFSADTLLSVFEVTF
ncbi:hypothetical protein LISA103140_09630 [Ligilactobacillus salivarius]